MARNRSAGNVSNTHQMRVNFTQQYRRQMGKDKKKNNNNNIVKTAKDSGKQYEIKVDGWTLYRDVCIMIAVLSILVFCLYIAFNVILYELSDIFPSMASVTVE